MALHILEKSLDAGTINHSTVLGLIHMRQTVEGNIIQVEVISQAAVSGTTKFQMRKEGVGLFSSTGLQITASSDRVTSSGLSFAGSVGDNLQLDLVSAPFPGGPTTPLTWIVTIDDGLGFGYQASSITSLAIGTGSKAFTCSPGDLAYRPGARAKAIHAADPTKWMEGVVTSYSSGILTIDVDVVAGSGTFADWDISIAGEQGLQGEQGDPGPQGDPGDDGADGADGISAFAISTVSHTTTSLADSAETDETAALGKAYNIDKIDASEKCRIRIYRNSTFRTNDAARPSGTLPTGQHGVVLDVTLTDDDFDSGDGVYRYFCSPVPFGISADDPKTSSVPIAVQNLSGGTTTIDIDFDIITLIS